MNPERPSPEEKHRRRLITILLQFMTGFTLLAAVMTFALQPTFLMMPALDLVVYIYLFASYAISWVLNQRGDTHTAAILAIVAVNIAGYVLTLPLLQSAFVLPVAIISLYLSSALLPLRYTFSLGLLNFVMLYIWVGVLAGESLLDVVLGPLLFITGFLGLVYGVHRYRREVRRDRRLTDEKYQRLVNVSRDALAILREEQVIEANPAFNQKIQPLPRGETLSLAELFPDHMPGLRQLMETDSDEAIEMEYQPASGDPFTAYVTISWITQAAPLFLISIRDITEMKEAEQVRIELELQKERVRLLREFIGDVRHDINTPLSVIKTSLYLLQRTEGIPEDNRHLKAISYQADTLSRMFDDLLSLSKLENSYVEIEMVQQNINDIIKTAYEESVELAAQRQQQLVFTPSDPPITVHVHPIEFSRAVRQLINNAIKYTPEGGQIHVRAEAVGDECRIMVQDNGIGIEADALPHLFKRFYRADKARGSNVGGMGLGLAIVQRVMEVHNGRVTVTSEPDKGSTFCLHMPLTKDYHMMPSS